MAEKLQYPLSRYQAGPGQDSNTTDVGNFSPIRHRVSTYERVNRMILEDTGRAKRQQVEILEEVVQRLLGLFRGKC